MLRDVSFNLFLILLPVPLCLFFPYITGIYILLLLFLTFKFFRNRFSITLILTLIVLVSSFIRYGTVKTLQTYSGSLVECKGVVLKQSNSTFNTTIRVLVPLLKTGLGNRIAVFKIFTVKTPLLFNDLTGKKVEIRGLLEKEKLYKNTFSSNYYYLLSTNKLCFIKVKGKEFIHITGNFPLLNLKKALLKGISDIEVKRFLNALILGDKNSLDSYFKNRVKGLGVYHLFVLSGFHFGIFSLILWILLFPLPLRKRYKKAITVLVLTILLVITSFSPPALRVYLMLYVYLLFEFDGIDISPLDAIGIAGILMLILNPFNSFNAGFLMSFFASAGIVITAKGKTLLFSYLLIPFAAFFTMLPFYLYFFNYIPLLAPIYNLLLIPLITFLFWIFIVNLLSFGALTEFLQWYTLKIKALLNFLPSSSIAVFPSLLIVLVSALIILVFFTEKRLKSFFAASIILLTISLIIPRFPHSAKICFFDSKSPQCTLIKMKNFSMLIGTGDSYFISMCLKKELGFRGIGKINCLVITNPNSRNVERIEKICRQIKVKSLVINEKISTSYLKYKLMWLAKFYRIKSISHLKQGKEYRLKNNVSLRLNGKGLKVKIKNKTLCFGLKKEQNCAKNCDFLILKNKNTHIIFTKTNCKEIKNRYSIEKNGELCLSLK